MKEDEKIPLHRTRGLDPHLTYCPRCGKDGVELVIGWTKKAQLPSGQWCYAMVGKTKETAKKVVEAGIVGSIYDLKWVDLDEYEKVPGTSLCDACQKEEDEFTALVAEGGVYWRCCQCQLSGVVKASPFAQAVRREMKIDPPAPCGVEFNTCSEHASHEEVSE